jgi:hypothetical protein
LEFRDVDLDIPLLFSVDGEGCGRQIVIVGSLRVDLKEN